MTINTIMIKIELINLKTIIIIIDEQYKNNYKI